MKKLLVILIFPILYACEIPTAVELRGNPELHLSTQMNMGKIFVEQLEEGFKSSDCNLVSCASTSNYTYIIHSDLFRGSIKINNTENGNQFIDGDFNGPLSEDKDLIGSFTPSEVPLSGIGDLLEGFTFSGSEFYLFVSGTKIVDERWLGVSICDSDGTIIPINDVYEQEFQIINKKESGYELWDKEYVGLKAPAGGYKIYLPLDGSDVFVKFRIYAKKGDILVFEDFKDNDIRVELVLWLPLEFRADHPDGAEIAFPGNFLGQGDLFGREDPEAESIATDIIENLNMAIKFNTNPFLGKDIVIQGGKNIEIRDEIKTNSLNITFNEENMALINEPENYPFTPTIKIAFKYNDTLKIHKLFSATEFIIKAKIRSIIKFEELLGKAGEPDETGESDDTGK